MALEKEYQFWMDKRVTPIGLNRYDWMRQPDEQMKHYAKMMRERITESQTLSEEEAARGLASAGESGWDLTPRMGCHTYYYAPADLNSLLYAMERNLAYSSHLFGRIINNIWRNA